MKLYITMTGLPELRRAFDNVTPEIERALAREVRTTTLEVVDGAKSRVPVLSGELRDTIRADFSANGLFGFIKAGYGNLRRRTHAKIDSKRRRRRKAADTSPGVYAMVVEFGSTKQAAQPYMFPALEAARAGFESRAEAALEPALQRAVQSAGADK